MKYVDFEVMDNRNYLNEKQIVIYGGGHFGKKALLQLRDLGIDEIQVVDSSQEKWGSQMTEGYTIISPKYLLDKRDLLIIIATENKQYIKEIEDVLTILEEVRREKLEFSEEMQVLSIFCVTRIWKYTRLGTGNGISAYIQYVGDWCGVYTRHMNRIQKACDPNIQVLVYQRGKVGSSSIFIGLRNAGVRCAHIHAFLLPMEVENSETAMAILKPTIDYKEEYINYIRETLKHKKIITLVRDPIAADFARVFENMDKNTETQDRFFAKKFQEGFSFSEACIARMEDYKNGLFEWFNRELREVFGIDIYEHPFDREKGYTIIKENDMEVLCLKLEKVSELLDVIRRFVGSETFQIVSENVGADKIYGHLYKAAKEKIVLPRDYIDFYYNGNKRVDHFYTEEEKTEFRNKWIKFGKQDEEI